MALKPGQKKCIETLDRSLVVAAGAGSGKTFTLTKRIVHAIESGAVDGIERVCAITFTNKAAGELKSRIKSELRACGLTEQALKVDEAWVSTIHGMCARILRAHAIELDIDPKFKMADATFVQRMQARAVDDVLRMAAGQGDDMPAGWPSRAAVDALFAEYPARSRGPRGTSVESMISRLMSAASGQVSGFDALVIPETNVRPERLVSSVADTFEYLAAETRGQKPNDAREAFAAAVDEFVPEMRAALEGASGIDAAKALVLLDKLPMPKKTGTADYKEQVSDALDHYRMCVMELRLAAARPHLETLVALARQASALFAAVKRAEGVLDNNDLLVLASDAITTHPEIAARYADKFQLIMVDEFQDTDQMQVDMIKLLAGPGACRLCTVGDAQQSIYRFRGADVSVYRRHLETVRAGNPEDVIMLPDNFRSHPDVLALVDRVFERPDMFGGSFMSLAPGREEAQVKVPFEAELPRIQVQLTTKPYRGVSTERMREEAAARIADAFADLHRRGHSAGEMAVLLGGMSYADVYARALRQRGLACVIAGGSVFSSSMEARVVLDLTRVAADPYQTEALFNVLTGPLFELSAGDLLELATSGGALGDEGAHADADGMSGDPADHVLRRRNLYKGLEACARIEWKGDEPAHWSPKLRLAVRVMGAFVRGAGRSTVSRIIMRAVVDSGWVGRLEARGAEGLASAANVYKAIRMVESVEADHASGPARTAALFQVLLEESKEAPGALSASGGDFVRIMTVHASKGLEFPIVAVGEFKVPGGDYSRLLANDVDGRTVLSLDLQNSVTALAGSANLASVSSLYSSMMAEYAGEDELLQAARNASGALELRAALYERERAGDVEEAKRLLYVALTRAKEALVVSLMGTRTKDNPCGTPKSCLGALVPALVGAGEGAGFDAGVSHFEFGGTAPALVEHIALEPEPDASADEGAAGGPEVDDAAAQASAGAEESFAIPEPEPYVALSRVPYAPAHEGVFSYSSIAEASHEGDVLDHLAQRFCVSVDAADQGVAVPDFDDGEESIAPEPDFSLSVAQSNRIAAVVDEDDGSWSYVGSSCADSDKATDLGTAFHRLAQYAVVTRGAAGALSCPPQERIDALARAGSLDGVQRARLVAALTRWFESDVAHEMSKIEDLSAEVPFFVPVEGAQGDAVFLEGEIDLLALDGDRAFVVDYKTGGHADEAEDALRRKHVLQASCYAYAIMLQGIREVEAVFVRVERPRDGGGQPQCVRYRFCADDMTLLEETIAQVYASAR